MPQARMNGNNNRRPNPTGARRPAPKKNTQVKKNLPVKQAPSKLSTFRTELMPMIKFKSDKIKTVNAKDKKPFPLSAVVIVTLCTFFLMITVFSYVQINEYTIEVAKLKSEVSTMINDKKELTLNLEKKNDMLAIEEYAQNNLGMVKSDQLTKKHVSFNREDKVEVVEDTPAKDSDGLAGAMSVIAYNFRGLWEYLG